MMRTIIPVLVLVLALVACEVSVGVQNSVSNGNPSGGASSNDVGVIVGDGGTVTNVVDGDTIDVSMNGTEYRVRYVGVNTPERDEVCYREATNANSALVMGQTVTLVRDTSDTDRYGRLLRYVYVNGVNVNAELVRQGYAEAVEYPPDTAQTATFRDLEAQAAAANLGCHPTGIFNDGSTTR